MRTVKKIIVLELFLLTLLSVANFTSCKGNSVKINMGVSKDDSVSLKLDGETEIEQNKIRINDNEINFYKHQENEYKNINLYFSGSNIRNIEINDGNETMIFNDNDKLVMGIDFLSFFTKVDEKILKNYLYPQGGGTYTLDTRKLGESCWDKGKFDDVRLSFANGQDYFNLTRVRKNKSNDYAVSFGEGNLFDEFQMNFSYDADTGYKIKEITPKTAHYMNRSYKVAEPFCSFSVYFNSYEQKRNERGVTEILVYGKNTDFDFKEDNNCVRWQYEKLFCNAYEEKNLEYKNIQDKAVIVINYNDSSSERYEADFRFNNKGNAVVKVKEIK